MFIYNVTTKLDHSIHERWVEWMKTKHISDVMASNCFVKYQFVRLLDTDETEGVTYAAQFFAESKADYNRYIEIYAPALRDDANRTWGNKFIGFRSLMEVVN
jgi:hypothetical protein